MIYIGKRFTSRVRQSRIVPCTCEKCQTVFFYELTRESSGSASAPYMLGQQSAADYARGSAFTKVNKRLATESELVPCPGCHWVNESLIAGFRKSYWLGLTPWRILSAMMLALLTCYVVVGLMDDPGDFGDVIFLPIVIGGSIIALFMGAQMLLFHRVHPNRDFPRPPRVPPGTPRAWTQAAAMQESSDDPFAPSESADDFPGWVVYRAGQLILPLVCCQCLGPPAISTPLTKPLNVPLCNECAAAYRAPWLLHLVLSLAVGALIGGPVAYLIDKRYPEGRIIIGLAAMIIGSLIAFMIIKILARPYSLRHLDRARSIKRVRFQNDQYTELVRKATMDYESTRLKAIVREIPAPI